MEPQRILTAEQAKAQAQVLESLSEVIRSGEAVLLVGSGCSMPMFPSWGELVQELAAVAAQCVPGGFTLPDRLKSDELEALQYIRDAMAKNQNGHHCLDRYEQRLIRLFEMNDRQPTTLHELLVALPFRGYLTTNYERLIERALDQARGPYEESRWIDVQTASPYFIGKAVRAMAYPAAPDRVIHLHGVNDRPEGMVLTTDDYRRAYEIPGTGNAETTSSVTRYRPPYARVLLAALMMTRRVVFVGFGLRDPFLMRVLQAVTEHSWEWNEPIHYAIMPIEETDAQTRWEQAEHLRATYGIEVLFYEVHNHDHRGLTETFEEIAARLGMVQRRMEVPAPAVPLPEEPPVPAAESASAPRIEEDARLAEQLEELTRLRVQRNLGPLDLPQDRNQEETRAD